MKKVTKIINCVSISLLVGGIGVGNYFAYQYAPIISTFLGCTEQIEGDSTQIEEGAKKGDEVVRKLANEGVVLLRNDKNKNGETTLPLPQTTKKINVFGWGATDSGFLLAGNGSGRSVSHEDNKVTLLGAFKESKIEYNEEIIKIYEDHCKNAKDWGETADWGNRYKTELKEPVTSEKFPEEVINRARSFSDTALVVLSRYSGEYLERIAEFQLKQGLARDDTRSFSQITTEEETLLKMCTTNFNNVIVVFNTGSIMDMSFLDDEDKVGHINAAMNVGYVGQSGATAIVKILTGEVNPSGKLANTVIYDPKENEITRINGKKGDHIVYQEDIYVGYKWFETADVENYFADVNNKYGKGYDGIVQYPFGHGLSYTSFDWELIESSLSSDNVIDKETEITLKIKVTNTGEVAGKDVVELYFTPPYYKGGIEKAHVNLLDYAKTPLLPAGSSCELEFKIDAYDLASYDCYSLNDNEATGWELDIGKYYLKFMVNSHTLKDMENNSLECEVKDEIIRFRKDPDKKENDTHNGRIRNRFTGDTAYGGLPLDGSTLNAEGGKSWVYLSRSNFKETMPTKKASNPSGTSLAPYRNYEYQDYNFETYPTYDQENNLRLVTKEDGSFASKSDFEGSGGVKLKYNDDLINELVEDYENPKWDLLLNQLSIDETRALIEGSGYGTQSVESIGKPKYLEFDGPSGFNRTNMAPNVEGARMTALPAENLVGQTWNKDLVYQAGQIIGIDGNNFGINGIYAPCVNLHREMLNGRNYECYSEDPVLSGFMAANFIKGAASNNVYCYLKHLALYDSGPYIEVSVWTTEQNFRENYLKPFEIAVKEGNANGIMISFNQIGPVWAGANYELLEGIVRGEWGFKGTFITDYFNKDSRTTISGGLRAGLNTELNPQFPNTHEYGVVDFNDIVEANLSRSSAKSIVYTSINTYYIARHGLANNENSTYKVEVTGPKSIKMGFPWWIPLLICLDVAMLGALGFWLFVTLKPIKVLQPVDDIKIDNEEIKKQKKKEKLNFKIEKLQQKMDELKKELSELE